MTEAANPHPPQEPDPAAGDWATQGFGWERPALLSGANPEPSLPAVDQPLEVQSWERWTDVWQPATVPATPRAVPSPVPDEEPVASPDPPPPAAEEPKDSGPADGPADDSSNARDATTIDNTFDSGEWWIVDDPPAREPDPHQWWIVDDSVEAKAGAEAPAPASEDDQESASPRAATRPRGRRERDSQHGWAPSLSSKKPRPVRSGDQNVQLAHQLRARRIWAMEETDHLTAEATTAARGEEAVGNVVRLPVENPSEANDQMPPERTSQEQPVTAIASVGSLAPQSVPTEAGPDESETVQPENASPDLKDLLDVAAVQAAVDAIVDAAVWGTSTGLDDDLE